MKKLTDVLNEINEYADTLKYDDIKSNYIISELKRAYSDLYFEFSMLESSKHISDLKLKAAYANWASKHPDDFLEDEDENKGMSECCSAPIYPDTDICSECKEHC
jgi:hypothetical protein